MYKVLPILLLLTACAAKSPTQAIVDSGVQQIERAQQIIKHSETLAQCQEKAEDSLMSAKATLVNAGESCKSETSRLEADLLRWKGYFWLLIVGIGVFVYFGLIRKLKKGII